MQRRPLDALLPWLFVAAVVVILGGAGYLLLRALRPLGGVFGQAWSILVVLPPSFAKTMSILVVLLVLAAGALGVLAWWETRSARRFARMEADLRLGHPLDVVVPYAGAEGDGVAFDGPDGARLLLLRPVAGVGEPRVVRIEPPPVEPAVEPHGEPAS